MMNTRTPSGYVKKKPNIFNTFKRDWHLWVMIIPAFVIIVVFQYIPMYGIQLAFRKYSFKDGITGGEWVGLKYFAQFFSVPNSWDLISNTMKIAILSIVTGFPCPIIIALIFNQVRSERRKRVLQTTVYMPNFISTVVLVSMLNIFFNYSGIFTQAMKGLGVWDQGYNPLGDPKTFLPMYLLSNIWSGAGWGSIIYLAALSNVDKELYDACKIDGASRFQTMWHVDIPCIVPTIVLLLILNAGGILGVGFEKVHLMTNALNQSETQVIATYTYAIGLGSHQYSYAAAIGLFGSVVSFTMTFIVNFIASRVGETSLW